jgi:uncharacterized protein YlxP (DUF503 family)
VAKDGYSMNIGVLRIYFMILDAQSLKNTFNVSVAEIGSNDKWQLGELGLATVGNDAKFVRSAMEEVEKFIESNPAIRVLESDIEII